MPRITHLQILMFIGITILALVLLNIFLTTNINLHRSNNVPSTATSKHEQPAKPTVQQLLAKSPRVSRILSYSLRNIPQVSNHESFIRELYTAIITDEQMATAYKNLREAGAPRSELIQLTSNTYLYRGTWTLNIEPGSFFYSRPFSRVLFINESFKVPACADGYSPYIAHMTTNPNLTIQVVKEPNLKPNGHRVIATNKNGQPVMHNLSDRVLLDAGCVKADKKQD